MVGPNPHARKQSVKEYFPEYEVLSATQVCYDLIGEEDRPDLNSLIFAEMRRRISLKLSLGERVVVDAANLRREDRTTLAKLATDVGAPVYYFVCDPVGADDFSLSRFKASERDIMRGDSVAEVIDWRLHEPTLVGKKKPDWTEIRQRWSGITVVADVHGMYQSLLSALHWARVRNHYVILLGDLIDYGPLSLETADEAYRLVMRGDGEIIMGNHERKIARWIDQVERGRVSIRLSEGNRVTTQALGALGTLSRQRWQGRFKSLVAHASPYRRLGNIVFAHGGVHPGYWNGSASIKDIEQWAMFGEFDPNITQDMGKPSRQYTWVDSVPADITVIVGHDIRSTERPFIVTNQGGGQTIFLDTGAGKGGQLSSADIIFTSSGLRVANYTMY